MTRSSTRRSLIVSALAALTGGCGISPVWRNAFEVARFLTVGQPDVEITRDVVDKIPYATISAKIGKGPRSILVLMRVQGRDLYWVSADAATIVTRDGRIVKTAGLPDNLRVTMFDRPDPVAFTLHDLKSDIEFRRTIDFDSGNLFGLRVVSTLSPIGTERISIAGLDIETVQIREENTVLDSIRWNFTNDYWVDSIDGFVWKSRQHISPKFAPIDFEVLKPAAL
jgi:hypothetical protein